MKRKSNVTAWQLRLFEGFDRDVMVMQRDEEEVFENAIHVFFEKDYYDAYLAKAAKYSKHRYAYHEDKLGEVIYQIFDEEIPGIVLHMQTQESGLCEEKYLDRKALFGLKDAAEGYHCLFMASIDRMSKEEAVAKLWMKTVYIIGTLPDPTKPVANQKVELMTMRRKKDGTPATADNFDYESLKIFLTAESAARFNPDKKSISKAKLAFLANNVKGKLQVIIEPHRNYGLEFDPLLFNPLQYLQIPKMDEASVRSRVKEFVALDECYILLATKVADYKTGISVPFLLKYNENTIALNVFEKYEDAVQYCLDNQGILPIFDGIFPIAKINNKDALHSLNTVACIAGKLGVTTITLNPDCLNGIGMKLPVFMDMAGYETELEAILSEEDCNRMRSVQEDKTLYRLPIFDFVDYENDYEITSARKEVIKKHIEEDKDKALAFLSGCSSSELIYALSEIVNKFNVVKEDGGELVKREYTGWINLTTVLLTESLLEKPFVYTLRNNDNTFTKKNDFAYIITTDRFENIRNSEGNLILASIDNENFMQKFIEESKVAIVTDGPNALAIVDSNIMMEVSKLKKKNEALKEEVIIYLTQALDMPYEEANRAYKKLKTDNDIFVEFLSTFRNGMFPPMGMININGNTAKSLHDSMDFNYFEAYSKLLDLKINPDTKLEAPKEEKIESQEIPETTEEKKSIFGKLFKK